MKFSNTIQCILCLLLVTYLVPSYANRHTDNTMLTSYMAPPTIVGSTQACPGSTVTYSVQNPDPSTTYSWSLPSGGIITSQSGGTATVLWDNISGGPHELSVAATPPSQPTETGYLNVFLEGDVVLVCNDNLNISLSEQCQVEITADIMLEGTIFPEESYTIEVRTASGILIDNIITGDYLNQTLEVTVIHNCSGNKCWGNILIEDKIAPVISCLDFFLTCDEFQTYTPSASFLSDNCNNATLEYSEKEIPTNCDPDIYKIIEYVWTAQDASGNIAVPCTSRTHVLREPLKDIEDPVNYDGLLGNYQPLHCDGNYPLNADGYPDPSFTGYPGGDYYCADIQFTYTDIFIPLCQVNCSYSNNSYKIIRNWTIVEWCSGVVKEVTQIIKVLDQTAPTFDTIPDITMGVNPFNCSAQIPLPKPNAEDNCTEKADITTNYLTSVGSVINGVLHIDAPAKTMHGSPVQIIAQVSDCCDVVALDTFYVTVADQTPPVVVADAHEVISLLPNGATTMYANSIDDGSYDNCGPIGFFVKRMDDGAPCPETDLYGPLGNDNAQFNEVVHFCCDDVNNGPIMVQFRVCDDADMDGVVGSHLDNCNTAMIEVEVQDKLPPVLQCPNNVVIECTDFYEIDPTNLDELNELFGTPYAAGTCDLDVVQTVAGADQLTCGEGIVTRTFTATTSGGVQTCTQTISVVPGKDAFLTCDRISFVGLDNNIYNWCLVNDNNNDDDDDLPAILINGCSGFEIAELEINTANLCTTVGYQVKVDTFTYTGLVCKKYVAHYEVIDQCLFDENFVNPYTGEIDPFNSLNGYYEFYLEYNVTDDEGPEFICKDLTLEGDNCDGFSGTITVDATDACTPDEVLVYEWKIDLDNNNGIDFPKNNKWHQGKEVSASVIGINNLVVGEHKIYWRISDGCGNVSTCSQIITVTPFLKPPTPYCYNGISIAVMQMSGEVEIWANDFDAGTVDDCGDSITITMIPEKVALESNNPFKDSKSAWTFSCDDITNGVFEILEIRVYFEDETGAYDYCTATLRLEDNEANACDDQTISSSIAGTVVDKNAQAIKDVVMTINSDQPEYPKIDQVDAKGKYSFDPNLYFNYTIFAKKEDSYLNGITTLDIVLIQKHILGIDDFKDPYTMIAADVNNDCKITGSDIVQLRKLILGKYSNNALPNVESWRFITNENVFFPEQQPCNVLEQYEINKLDGKLSNQDFFGIKMGDVNNTAKTNAQGENIDTRTNETLTFTVDNQWVEEGEYVTVEFNAENYSDVAGYQFTLNFDPERLSYLSTKGLSHSITEESINTNEANTGTIILSYADVQQMHAANNEGLFQMTFKALAKTKLSDELAITSNGLRAEAYVGNNLEVANIELAFEGLDHVDTKQEFVLYQNKPNPFKSKTVIGFELAKAGLATIKIYDVAGHILYTKEGKYEAGYNEIEVKKSDLVQSGILYLQLESNGEKAIKKMILM